MIHLNQAFFVILSWMIIGRPLPITPAIVFLTLGIVSVLVLRRSFRPKTVALLAILGVMFAQSIQLVLEGLHIEPFNIEPLTHHPLHFEIPQGVGSILSLLFGLDFRLAEIGVLASVCVALYIVFGKSRLDMTKAFPEMRFFDPPGELEKTTNMLAQRAGIKTPEIRLLDSGVPSAFTVRNKRRYTIAVSVGLLESFENQEVEACIAHEISHLKNRDFALRLIATLAKVALFAKPLSYLIEPAIYRAREFLADRTAASLIGGPDAMISALVRLQESNDITSSLPTGNALTCCLAGSKGILSVFDKHPDLKTRIRMLQELKTS